jgi:biopolymer transport protein ExbB/TolQ
MQFELITAGPTYGPIGQLAILYMSLGVLAMVYMFISMLRRYNHIRRQIWLLVEPILAQVRKGEWEPSVLISRDSKDPQLSRYAAALRQELSGQGPIAIIESVNKTLDLLGRRVKQMIYYSRLLAWSICFVGFIGAISHTWKRLYVGPYLKDYTLGLLAGGISEAVKLLIIALIIGLVCLAGSYFLQSRLSSLYLEIADRILKAAEERTAPDLKV